MTEHKTGTREEWLAGRLELLEAEKELTRRSDELARKRKALPCVAVEEEYRFETGDGTKTLAELFEGRSQLLVYHFMFGPMLDGWPDRHRLQLRYPQARRGDRSPARRSTPHASTAQGGVEEDCFRYFCGQGGHGPKPEPTKDGSREMRVLFDVGLRGTGQ